MVQGEGLRRKKLLLPQSLRVEKVLLDLVCIMLLFFQDVVYGGSVPAGEPPHLLGVGAQQCLGCEAQAAAWCHLNISIIH